MTRREGQRMIVEILGGPHDGLTLHVGANDMYIVIPLSATGPRPTADEVRHVDGLNLHEVAVLDIEPQYNPRGDRRLIARWPGRHRQDRTQ